jgi:hypothetical protein
VGHWLTLPVHHDVVGVVMREHAMPIGAVPSGEVEIVHSSKIAIYLIIARHN